MKKRTLFLMIVLMCTMFLLCACGKKTYIIEDFEKVVEDDSSNFDDVFKFMMERKFVFQMKILCLV